MSQFVNFETIDVLMRIFMAVLKCLKLWRYIWNRSYCVTKFVIMHHTHYEKSDWSRAFSQFTIACELGMINAISAADICCRYCVYHVKFNVCLVTKPLGVFFSETKWLNASLLFLKMNYVKNV